MADIESIQVKSLINTGAANESLLNLSENFLSALNLTHEIDSNIAQEINFVSTIDLEEAS